MPRILPLHVAFVASLVIAAVATPRIAAPAYDPMALFVLLTIGIFVFVVVAG